MKIIINNCNALDEALRIRQQYSQLCPNSKQVTIDLSLMPKNSSQELLIGVLINIKKYFSHNSKITICNPPPQVNALIEICRLQSIFELI